MNDFRPIDDVLVVAVGDDNVELNGVSRGIDIVPDVVDVEASRDSLRGLEKRFFDRLSLRGVCESMIRAFEATARGEARGKLPTLVAGFVLRLSSELVDDQ